MQGEEYVDCSDRYRRLCYAKSMDWTILEDIVAIIKPIDETSWWRIQKREQWVDVPT